MNLLLDWKFPVNNDFVRNVRFYGRLDKLERLLKVTTDGQERLLMSNLIKQEDFVSIDDLDAVAGRVGPGSAALARLVRGCGARSRRRKPNFRSAS